MLIGLGYAHSKISALNANKSSPSLIDFTNKYGHDFDQVKASAGWSRVTTDRVYFPRTGGHQAFGFVLGVPYDIKHSLGYYALTYRAAWYVPVGSGFIVKPHTYLGYGRGFGKTDRLPFFDNFSGGGMGTLIGFDYNTLGPKNPRDVDSGIGGNVAVFAGLDLILPEFFSEKLRTAITVQTGNIFETQKITTSPAISYESVRLKNMRASAGITLAWFWPFGPPIKFGIAKPIRDRSGDRKRFFTFSLTSGF